MAVNKFVISLIISIISKKINYDFTQKSEKKCHRHSFAMEKIVFQFYFEKDTNDCLIIMIQF